MFRGGIRILLYAFALCAVPTCSNKAPNSAEAELQADDESDDDESDDDEFPHPKKNDSWHTKVLIQTNKMPEVERLSECRSELKALARDRENESGLQEMVDALQPNVTEKTGFYHWCFYWSVQSMDEAIKRRGTTIDEKGKQFYSAIMPLWSLAQALDDTNDTNHYSRYLRARYVELSHSVFGRRLRKIGPPVKSFPRVAPHSDDEETVDGSDDYADAAGDNLDEEQGPAGDAKNEAASQGTERGEQDEAFPLGEGEGESSQDYEEVEEIPLKSAAPADVD